MTTIIVAFVSGFFTGVLSIMLYGMRMIANRYEENDWYDH